MGYLVYNDYAVTIQDSAFKQWIASNDLLRLQAEPRAQAKIKEYLVQKYDLVNEFQSTTVFSESPIYQANTLVQLNASAWVLGAYLAGAYVSYTDGNVYRCILNTVGNASPGNATYWILVGQQLGLVYMAYPYPLFNAGNVYAIGDRVFWKCKIYQCLIATNLPSHFSFIQDGTYANVSPYNYFPTDPINGLANWGAGVSYSVSGLYPNAVQSAWSAVTAYVAGNRVIDVNGVVWKALKASTDVVPGVDIVTWQSETWTVGDNRNQSIIDAYVAITLYYLSFRIAPKVIPAWVQNKYDAAMIWLQYSAEGDITLDVPEVQPAQGARIRFGGQTKRINGY